MKLLSVVVPCYNSQDYMENCIESLLKGGDRIEIIIIDDGSKDKTGEIADGYAAKYKDIVKVIHQENGGHGEGINSGLKNATGKFFKVVDSDDMAGDCLTEFLDALDGPAADADIVITNYVYTYQDGRPDNRIHYRASFKSGVLYNSWDETKKLHAKQYVTLHSATFKRERMIESKMVLPKHVFYEDNVMICTVLPYTEKVFYLDCDLYRYWIGREGQSVAEDVMTKRYKHQILAASLIFETCHLDEVKVKSKRLYQLMYHEMWMMFGIACAFARRSPEKDSFDNLVKMWDRAYAFDEKYAVKLRKRSSLRFMNIKGKFGKKLSNVIYKFAHSIVNFN